MKWRKKFQEVRRELYEQCGAHCNYIDRCLRVSSGWLAAAGSVAHLSCCSLYVLCSCPFVAALSAGSAGVWTEVSVHRMSAPSSAVLPREPRLRRIHTRTRGRVYDKYASRELLALRALRIYLPRSRWTRKHDVSLSEIGVSTLGRTAKCGENRRYPTPATRVHVKDWESTDVLLDAPS